MTIVVGDIHGSIKQFAFPILSNGFADKIELNEELNELELVNVHIDKRMIFIGDIYYGDYDVYIGNTLARLVLNFTNVEWLIGNRDMFVFGKIFAEKLGKSVTIKETSFAYNIAPFDRFHMINRDLILSAFATGRIKVTTRLDNYLVSHAAITEDGIREFQNVIDMQSIEQVFNTDAAIETMELPVIEYTSIDDLNSIFSKLENWPLYFAKLQIFWNHHIFTAIQDSIIGHEVFCNEYPSKALPKIQKYGSWLTDEYRTMCVYDREDRMKQFQLTEVHYNGATIKTNIKHVDCNCCIGLPCYFMLENGKWSEYEPDEPNPVKISTIKYKGQEWKVPSETHS